MWQAPRAKGSPSLSGSSRADRARLDAPRPLREDVCRRCACALDVPILMLTAKASRTSVEGLALGADDYLTKPFSPRASLLCAAILRRTQGAEQPLVPVLRFDDACPRDRHGFARGAPRRRRRRADSKRVQAADDAGPVPRPRLPRFELINHVQGYDYEGYERTIDAHVKNLRRKIEPDPRHPRYVETVFGVGYRLAKR